MQNPPRVIGWAASNTDNGYVDPVSFGSPDIICHKSATPAGGHARVNAGDKISIIWNTWPDSHHGPVVDYLANCHGDCETVDKTTLEFFKIDGAGYVSGSSPGYWATDVLMADGLSWLVQIPADLASGNYVLRHELIALHSANNLNGAQAYPQCFNLAVVGTGTLQPAGVRGTELYKNTDPGISYNLYSNPMAPYTVPGPPLVYGLPSSVSQSSSAATVTSSATQPGGTPPATTASTRKTTMTVPTSSTTAFTSIPQPTPQRTGSSSDQTTARPDTTTTLTTVVTPAPSQTQAATGASCEGQSLYGQCGGSQYVGLTSCRGTATCSVVNPWYYQCVPGSDGPGQKLYAQCGGNGWTGGTACVKGSICVYQNAYYSQCRPIECSQ